MLFWTAITVQTVWLAGIFMWLIPVGAHLDERRLEHGEARKLAPLLAPVIAWVVVGAPIVVVLVWKAMPNS